MPSTNKNTNGHAKIQELDLTVEEEFLDLLLKLVRELPLADIYQMDAQPASQPMQSSRGIQTALQVSPPFSSTVVCIACWAVPMCVLPNSA